MSLFQCPDCGTCSSTRLPACTKCGRAIRGSKSSNKTPVIISVVTLGAAVLVGIVVLMIKNSGGGERKGDPDVRGLSVTVICQDYNNNAVAAAKLYEREQPSHVWGYVKQVRAGGTVALTGEDISEVSNVLYAVFLDREMRVVEALRPGQIVSLKGRILGLENGNIIMHDCEFTGEMAKESEKSKEDTAKLQAALIEKAIMGYYIRNDAYPASLQQLTVKDARGGGPDLPANDINDPWGQKYKFDVAGKQSGIKNHIDVWTRAASGKRIDNWTRK